MLCLWQVVLSLGLAAQQQVDVSDTLHDNVQLSTTEAELKHRREFNTVDINKDGELWFIELEAVDAGFGAIGHEVWDSNDDGVVTFDEYRLNDLVWQTVRQHDLDGDGFFTAAELASLTLPGFSSWATRQQFVPTEDGWLHLEKALAPKLRSYLPELTKLLKQQHKVPLAQREPLVRALFEDAGSEKLSMAQAISIAGKLALARVEPKKGTAQYEQKGNQENMKREGGAGGAGGAKYAHFARVTDPRPDTKKYRQFYQVRPYKVTLNPGDFLFIPRGWWHWIRSYGRSYAYVQPRYARCRCPAAILPLTRVRFAATA